MSKISILISILVLFSCKKDNKNISYTRNDSGIVLEIPLSGSLQNPAFSPDDNSIVFTRFVNGYNKEPSDIYKYNLNTKNLTLLVSDGSANVNLPGSSWRNGKIVFSSSRYPHDEIFIIPDSGHSGDETQITSRQNKVAYEPSFSPNGEWIVFESHHLDIENDGVIIKYKSDGTSAYIELTNQGEDCRQPNWSPNGNKILYQKQANNQWNIWTMNTDGTNKIQVTHNLGNCTDASFTADGQNIVFSSDYQANIANIYRISTVGNHLEKLTDFDGYDGAVSISSDGTKLIFESISLEPDDSRGTKIVLLNLF